ncbi:phage minor head protein [Lonepinella sp. BR2271]|uniref:phage minor head protein n=1 Tax=Lonepinella sp. BR2271 TaxID=3434550 RepID=UPI003F6DA88F
MADVGFLLGLEPKKAIEFLQNKKVAAGKLNQASMIDSATARAISIANLSSLEMTKDIYQSLAEAQAKGIAFGQWKRDLVAHFAKKGWVAGHDKKISRGIDGTILADPKTGELFGTPRRLETIFRTNMQQAFAAQNYQALRDNADERPYWQYSAVNDDRTRPSHGAMDGLIYRFDDPFWSVFYPPNGFNCRCTVIALADRDIERDKLFVSDGEDNLVEHERPLKQGTEKTTAFKLPDGRLAVTDRGFDYNVGKMSYRPNLDNYPETLAHAFAKREMSGGEFRFEVARLEKDMEQIKQRLNLSGKLNEDQMITVRNQLRKEYKFAAGVFSQAIKKQLKSDTATVWISDDTLVKQLNSRLGQEFGFDEYGVLPDVIYSPDKVVKGNRENHFEFLKEINGNRYVAVIKNLNNEIFLQSFRIVESKKWRKLFGSN